jgi:hypothetical protein
VIGFGQLNQSHILLLRILKFNVLTTELWRNHVVAGAVHKNLARPDRQLHRVGLTIVLHNFGRLATEKLDNSIRAQMKIEGALEIDHSSERDRASDRWFMRGEAKRQLSSGGVAHHNNPFWVELIVACDLRKKTAAIDNVFERRGPSAAGISDAAVFDIPGGASSLRECRTQMAGVKEVVLSPPISAVDVHHHGNGHFLSFCWKPKVAELVRVRTVSKAIIGRGRAQGEDVFRHSLSSNPPYFADFWHLFGTKFFHHPCNSTRGMRLPDKDTLLTISLLFSDLT